MIDHDKPTCGSLFAGFGGFELGFERAGWECKWQVEIDPFCRKVLTKHWPGVPKHDDVRTFPPTEGDWYVDAIIGGDPCQENSLARSGSRTTQPSLGHEFVRIVEEIRPRFVLRENPSRVRADAPWPWWRMRRELERLGYSVLPFRLRACCLGADHQRDRLFLLAELGDADRVESGLGGRVEFAEGREETGHLDLWPNQPEPPRVADGVSRRMERNRGTGNAVCPPAAEFIGRRLIEAVAKEGGAK